MMNLEFSKNGVTYKQVSKAAAHKLYDNGKKVVFCASNLNPFGIMGGAEILKNENNYDFNALCNSFYCYNCINAETGKYIRFYAVVE